MNSLHRAAALVSQYMQNLLHAEPKNPPKQEETPRSEHESTYLAPENNPQMSFLGLTVDRTPGRELLMSVITFEWLQSGQSVHRSRDSFSEIDSFGDRVY